MPVLAACCPNQMVKAVEFGEHSLCKFYSIGSRPHGVSGHVLCYRYLSGFSEPKPFSTMANTRSSGAALPLWGLHRALFALACALAAPVFATEVAPTAKTDLTELPLEALMQMDVPKVVGASKFEQKTTEAPASVTVVSNEEIKRYG